MYVPGQQFLAGAGFADDQYRGTSLPHVQTRKFCEMVCSTRTITSSTRVHRRPSRLFQRDRQRSCACWPLWTAKICRPRSPQHATPRKTAGRATKCTTLSPALPFPQSTRVFRGCTRARRPAEHGSMDDAEIAALHIHTGLVAMGRAHVGNVRLMLVCRQRYHPLLPQHRSDRCAR